MVKTMLPVQRNKDEYEFQEDNNQCTLQESPTEIDDIESRLSSSEGDNSLCFMNIYPLNTYVDVIETVISDAAQLSKQDDFIEMKEQ